MNKTQVLFALTLIGCSYSSLTIANDDSGQRNPQQERIDMENKQAQLLHTEDFVSSQRGERRQLLQAPVKKDDAPTAKPADQQQ